MYLSSSLQLAVKPSSAEGSKRSAIRDHALKPDASGNALTFGPAAAGTQAQK